MQTVAIPDALNAIEDNIRVFLTIAGEKPGSIHAQIDVYTGTASITHTKDRVTKKIDVVVNMPCAKAQTRLTSAELDRWVGYFLHELCHALYTNEADWHTACVERIHVMVNALEDIRIEKKFNRSGIAANSRDLLNRLLAWVVGELPKDYDPNDPKDLPWLLAMCGRVTVCGYVIAEAQAHYNVLSPAMRKLVDHVLADVAKARSTGDILDIVRKLQADMRSNPARTNPGKGKPGEGKPGEGKASQSGTGDGKPDDTGNDAEASVDGSQGAGNGKPGEGKPGEGKSGSGGGTYSDEISGDVTQGKAVDLKPLTERQAKESDALLGNGTASIEAAVIDGIRKAQNSAGRKLKDAQPSTWDDGSIGRLNRDAMACGTMRQNVARVLKAEETETWERGKSTGRIDRFAMGRIAAGAQEGIYAKRTITSGYETEISVLVDSSGSMGGAPMWSAGVLAYVIAQAAQQVGVKCEVIRFHSAAFESVKGVNVSPSGLAVQSVFAQMAKQVGGSTPLTQSIIKTAARLASRAAYKRKLLFVVSDGSCDSGPKAVKRACDYAEALGVETVALCIGVPVHEGFRHGVTCDVLNIAKAGLGKLVQVLARE